MLIGIDDTDNLQSRGTGFRARQLVDLLHDKQMAQVTSATRHQLLVDDRIPYTSHNSSACIAVETDRDPESLREFCRDFLMQIAADGSDVGLCIADREQGRCAATFGWRAKTEVLKRDDAWGFAGQHGILLEGLTGDRQGVIGALAAVGLYSDGNDGRYLWLRGLRDQAHRLLSVADLFQLTAIDDLASANGEKLTDPDAMVDLGSWPRTVRIDGRAVLLVEKTGDNQYKVLDKNLIKSIRP